MNIKSKSYRSNGKLLLTAEYAVLDGAKALAIPTKYGQSLKVTPNGSNIINWKSHNELGAVWFESEITLKEITTFDGTRKPCDTTRERLIQILNAAQDLNPDFLTSNLGYHVSTDQDFNRFWGLGTSSTLINNIANWANVDAFKLLQKTFGGSGYDIACAQHDHPITFQLDAQNKPLVKPVNFSPNFKHQLYFVYLNQKQNSRAGIEAYKNHGDLNTDCIIRINAITEAMIDCQTLSEFKNLIAVHEALISNLVRQEPIKTQLFPDFDGAVKSLGAWGGDFVLVACDANPTSYFNECGFGTVIPYVDMVL